MDHPVRAEELRWQSEPLPALEDRDYLLLDDEELLIYIILLQDALRTLRVLWHDTLDALTQTLDERDHALWELRRARGR